MEIVIVTGMSGAGKTEALKCLEDLGFYAIDNLPPSLLVNIPDISVGAGKSPERVAVVMDVRSGRSFEELFSALEGLRNTGVGYTIVFLDASDDVLVRRFSQTRRIHPLDGEGLRVADTIAEERRLLERLLERADVVIDTTHTNINGLRDKLNELVGAARAAGVTVTLISFGYKFGLPLDADIVIDLRFLPNPYWVAELQELDGLDPRVVEYVLERAEASEFLERFVGLVEFMLPLYLEQRKTHLTVGIGCTGGRHRSVAVAVELARRLSSDGHPATVAHRDKDRK